MREGAGTYREFMGAASGVLIVQYFSCPVNHLLDKIKNFSYNYKTGQSG
jgi:hypothetical protein